MMNILMYCHNGSGNHGCEAIIRSTVGILDRAGAWQYYRISRAPDEDRRYGVGELVRLLPEYSPVEHSGGAFLRAYLEQKLLHRPQRMDGLSARVSFRVPQGPTVSLSIGGDNYCYNGYRLYTGYHRISRELGHKTALWGCSVEPDFLEYPDLLADLKTFDKILVRESISYEAMRAKGLTNLVLCPDPAFTLSPCPAPKVLPPENTVGVNISPMALRYGSEQSDILGNYETLIRNILTQTDMQVALIPHVVWAYNDDREVLRTLKARFADDARVFLVEDMDCTALKAYISHLRFFVGARTHATIAAYSTGVPTLVAGYSVKSRGIARDLFGTEENYVVPVDRMTDAQELTGAFRWIMAHEDGIRAHLRAVMPEYIGRAYRAGEELLSLLTQMPALHTGIAKEQCTGCGACVNACPADCLHMTADTEGFRYPAVNAEACIRCGKCAAVCPAGQVHPLRLPQECYAMKHKSERIRLESSSGGVFTVLAEQILDRQGIVYGAALDAHCAVQHVAITDRADLPALRGAKYSQSNLGLLFRQIRRQLIDGKFVLFSGTPCQVAGLRAYLKKDYETLVCVDFICHGVPSPLVWAKYLEQAVPGAQPEQVRFRSKESGWSRYRYSIRMDYGDGSSVVHKNCEDLFLQGMVCNLFLRPACAACKFKGGRHLGDITLGDFWGIWEIDPAFDDDKGVSAVMVNSAHGGELLRACTDSVTLRPVTLEQIKRENPSWAASSFAHEKRGDFFAGLAQNGRVDEQVAAVLQAEQPKTHLIDVLAAAKRRLKRR